MSFIGRQIVEYLEENLENNIYHELITNDEASILDKMSRWISKFSCPHLILKYRAFLITDMESRKVGITTSGATAVSMLIHNHPDGKMLHIANVGDSRAVLCSSLSEAGWVGE